MDKRELKSEIVKKMEYTNDLANQFSLIGNDNLSTYYHGELQGLNSALKNIDLLDEPEVLSQGRKDLDYQVSLKVEQARQDGYMKGKEAWVRDVLRNRGFKRGSTDYAVIEKPVIPNFVAEWIKNNEKHLNSSVFYLTGLLKDRGTKEDYQLLDWLEKDEDNGKLFARAWLDGYEVGEPIYVLKVNGKYINRFEFKDGYNHDSIELTYSSRPHAARVDEKTKVEIEKYLNVEVEELEE